MDFQQMFALVTDVRRRYAQAPLIDGRYDVHEHMQLDPAVRDDMIEKLDKVWHLLGKQAALSPPDLLAEQAAQSSDVKVGWCWTAEQDATLVAMWPTHSPDEIAAAIGRTRAAVIARHYRSAPRW
jgi:hypothetical protein